MWNLRRLRDALATAVTCLAIAGNGELSESELAVTSGPRGSSAKTLQKTAVSSSAKTIQKTAVSSRLRLIFFAGLEGTGHHLLSSVFKNMYEAHPDLETIPVCVGNELSMSELMSKSPEHYAAAREATRLELRMLVNAKEGLGSLGTIITVQRTIKKQKLKCAKYGMLSYPNYYGPDKALSYPDLQMLAALAEEEGVDLRVVYLQRSAMALLVSNVVHRNFHESLMGIGVRDERSAQAKFVAYAQVLMVDLAALHSSLAELGPGFTECFLYDERKNTDQAWRVAQFVSPTATVAEYFRSTLLETAREPSPSTEGLNFRNATVVVSRLQNKLDVLEAQYCGRSSTRV